VARDMLSLCVCVCVCERERVSVLCLSLLLSRAFMYVDVCTRVGGSEGVEQAGKQASVGVVIVAKSF
jgi:hypothetical protein